LAPPFFAAPFFAEDFLAPFFAPPFFAVFFAAMLFSWDGEQVLALRETLYDGAQDTIHSVARNRELLRFPSVFAPISLCDCDVRACDARAPTTSARC
jgi:hypothetical protein